jgi:hypothetical protein
LVAGILVKGLTLSVWPTKTMTTASTSLVPVLETPTKFAFPFPKPYDIQLQLMRTVFGAIEKRQIAIVRPKKDRLNVAVI